MRMILIDLFRAHARKREPKPAQIFQRKNQKESNLTDFRVKYKE
jgi:hypothetical protein